MSLLGVFVQECVEVGHWYYPLSTLLQRMRKEIYNFQMRSPVYILHRQYEPFNLNFALIIRSLKMRTSRKSSLRRILSFSNGLNSCEITPFLLSFFVDYLTQTMHIAVFLVKYDGKGVIIGVKI